MSPESSWIRAPNTKVAATPVVETVASEDVRSAYTQLRMDFNRHVSTTGVNHLNEAFPPNLYWTREFTGNPDDPVVGHFGQLGRSPAVPVTVGTFDPTGSYQPVGVQLTRSGLYVVSAHSRVPFPTGAEGKVGIGISRVTPDPTGPFASLIAADLGRSRGTQGVWFCDTSGLTPAAAGDFIIAYSGGHANTMTPQLNVALLREYDVAPLTATAT